MDDILNFFLPNADMDGDGIFETEISLVDVDGDNIPDMEVALVDVDGNYTPDVLEQTEYIDSDGDGMIDGYITSTDMNMDGTSDITQVGIDTNQDGLIDHYEVTEGIDLNSDGIIESYYTQVDVNNDGMVDIMQSGTDTNNDGHVDIFSETTYHDVDGDGIIDEIIYADNSNDENVLEYTNIYQDFNGDGYDDMTFNTIEEIEFNPMSILDVDLPNFDPNDESIDHSKIIGNPGEDMEHWQQQTYDDTCAINAQMFALEELTGIDFDEDALRDVAMQNGWYDDGTPMNCIGNLLEAYGLDVVKNESGTIEDITRCLENGGKVVVGVDGDEIWYENHDTSIFAPNDPNHAIEVIGIDYSNPDEPMVILNDSGIADGCGCMVPLDQFADAWEDSGCFMIEAYAA